MNKAYKVVFNESTGTYVAVSEIESSKGKSSGTVKAIHKIKLLPVFNNTLNLSQMALAVFATVAGFMLPMEDAVANILLSDTASCGTSTNTSTGPDGQSWKTSPGAAVDGYNPGTAYWSTVAGCGANGGGTASNYWGVTLYGSYIKANGQWATAMGFGAAAAEKAVAIGVLANAFGANSVAIGQMSNTFSTAKNGVALGSGATAVQANSISVGTNSNSIGENSISFGTLAVSCSGQAAQDTFI